MRLGLVPYFALGPVADVSNPTASGGNQLVIGMRGVNGWLDVRGPELSDIGETPSNRGPGGGNSTHSQKMSNDLQLHMVWKGCSLAGAFRNDINAVSRHDAVSTTSSLLAVLVSLTGRR